MSQLQVILGLINSCLSNNNSSDLNDNGSNISLELKEEEIKFALDYEASEPIF
jgi:hypothetical protein